MIFAIGLLLLALIGVPLFALLGAAALGASLPSQAGAWSSSAIDVLDSGWREPKLAAVPLFLFAGSLLAHSGAPRRIWRLSQAWLGWLPGGFALAALPTAAFLGAFAGDRGDGAASTGPLRRALFRAGYPERFATQLVTAGGAVGLLFAPSLALLLYDPVAGLTTRKAVVAGIGPGLLALGLLGAYAALIGARCHPVSQRFARSEAMASLVESKWELVLVVALIAALAGALVRLHEAAAFTVLYVLAVEVLVHRDVDRRRDMTQLVAQSAATAGAVLLVLALAIGLFALVVQGELLLELTHWMQGRLHHSKLLFLLIANAFLLIVGMVLDPFVAIALVAPALVQPSGAFGVEQYHLAAIVLLNLVIGCLTRPIAHDLLLAPPRSGESSRTPELYREAVPFIGVLLVALLVVTCVPAIATWLPDQIPPRKLDFW